MKNGFVAVAVTVVLAATNLLAQGGGQISGTAKDEAKQPFTEFSVRARDVAQGQIAATTALGVDGSFTLPNLGASTYVVELLNRANRVVCREGPFNLTAVPVRGNVVVDCNRVPGAESLIIAAAAAAGVTAGVVSADTPPAPGQPNPPTASDFHGADHGQPLSISRPRSLSKVFSRYLSTPAGSSSTGPGFGIPQGPRSRASMGGGLSRKLIFTVALCLVLHVATAWAQAGGTAEPGENALFRLGRVRYTPSLLISDIGKDTNVFNEPDNPKTDTTASVGPAVAWWLTAGRAHVSASNGGQYMYFKEYENQRGWNSMNTFRVDVRAGRLKPFALGSFINTRNRPGYEIDSRSRARTTTVLLGSDLRLSGKTSLGLSASKIRMAFDEEETFLGATLARRLNHDTTIESLELHHALTPLTTFVVKGEALQDRFEVEDVRNANSIRILPGFEFKPFALISGQVLVGYRHFDAVVDTLMDYQGPVAAVTANTIIRATRLEVVVNKDLVYSYEQLHPYYALTDAGLTLTQRFARSWDVRGRGAVQRLAYRSFVSNGLTTGPVDRGNQYGVGIGYRVGDVARIGMDLNYVRRLSDTPERRFEGYRLGASISYGLQQ